MGAPVIIKTLHYDPMEIAKAEFKKGALPITVRRSLPKKLK
jgi:DNA-directed RNA polymerase subunit K/omega